MILKSYETNFPRLFFRLCSLTTGNIRSNFSTLYPSQKLITWIDDGNLGQSPSYLRIQSNNR